MNEAKLLAEGHCSSLSSVSSFSRRIELCELLELEHSEVTVDLMYMSSMMSLNAYVRFHGMSKVVIICSIGYCWAFVFVF